MVLKNASESKTIKKLEGIRTLVAKLPFKFKNDKVSITVSAGITHVRKDDNIHIAFERADEALYKAKNKGRNCVVYS